MDVLILETRFTWPAFVSKIFFKRNAKFVASFYDSNWINWINNRMLTKLFQLSRSSYERSDVERGAGWRFRGKPQQVTIHQLAILLQQRWILQKLSRSQIPIENCANAKPFYFRTAINRMSFWDLIRTQLPRELKRVGGKCRSCIVYRCEWNTRAGLL